MVDQQAVQESLACLIPGTRVVELCKLEREFPQHYFRLATQSKAVAERVLSGSWEMLGHRYDLRSPIDWHRDPRSEFCWPKGFYADVPLYELEEGVDVKYVWELGRQQYLVDLARGWRLSGAEKYAGRARELLLDWIKHNPLYEGIHWTSGLEVAMRVISWLWTLATLSEWNGWQPRDFSAIIRSLEDHATYLEHHFSFYSSPYNHLIGEATALLLIGLVFGETDEAPRWRTRGREVLVEHGGVHDAGDEVGVLEVGHIKNSRPPGGHQDAAVSLVAHRLPEHVEVPTT
ncbi:MAG: hypothetical protein IH943_07665 [Acidobacteria bacterium]|nr:hypothetical protein [Acidobacteriota bacterium]